MITAPPTQATCSSSRRCLQTSNDAIDQKLRGTACQGQGSANCNSCYTNHGTFKDDDLFQNLSSDCGDGLNATRTNLCMAGNCYTTLSNDPDIIPGNTDCLVNAGRKQQPLRVAGCGHNDIDLYCKNKAVGPAGCHSEYQTYENTDGYQYWKRPYGSGNLQNGYKFGANCPGGTRGVVMQINNTDYSVCMPLLVGMMKTHTCPAVPRTSKVYGKINTGLPVEIGGVKACLLPCEDEQDCPGGQECVSQSGVKFCAGRNGSDNAFYKDPMVSQLFRNQGCHSMISGSNPDCHSCIKQQIPTISSQQASLFCDNGGMFHKVKFG